MVFLGLKIFSLNKALNNVLFNAFKEKTSAWLRIIKTKPKVYMKMFN